MLTISQIKETCIYVKDLEATSGFYHGKLGLEIISRGENRHIFFRANQSVLLCFIAEATVKAVDIPPHGATGSIHFAFEIEEGGYNEAVDHMKENDIAIVHQQVWKNGKRSFYFHDPDGNLVEIVEQGLWAS